MAHKVTIECEARFVDHMSDESRKASDAIDDLGTSADEAREKVDRLGKKKFKPIFDADNNKFLKKIREMEARAQKLGRTKTAMVLKAVDKATSVIGKVMNSAQRFAHKTWSAILKVKNSQAVEAISKVAAAGKSIAGKTWSAVISVKDNASSVISKIKDSLFNIKNLIGTIVAGYAVKQAASTLIASPVGLADTIESSRIAFESKLGSADAAEGFLQDIYKFDEKSPFDTMQIVGITQQMMNLGWTAENVLEDLGTIGDWSASLGKGEAGISSVTRALGQMRMKGKLSAEEMLQLTEAGVSAWQYLADYMGKDISTVREMAEDGLIDVDTAIKGIMAGMGEYTGSAAALADRTTSGLIDQIKSLYQTYVKLPWGEGLSEGFKDALVKVRDLIENNKENLKKFGETAKEVGKKISSWFASKVENALTRITEIMDSEAFKKGSITKKINMLFDGVIKNPFSGWWRDTVVPWWDGTAMPWLAEKAAGLGEAIGKGLTSGLLVLLGLDATGAVEDGVTIGGAFMEGFLEGFDTDKIGEALSNWVSENKGLATALGTFLGIKFFSWFAGFAGNLKTLFGGGGSGEGGLSSASTMTMTVTADIVNVYGNNGFNTGNYGGGGTGGTGGGTYLPTSGGGSGGGTLLLPNTGGTKTLLGGGKSAVKGLLGSGGAAAGTKTLPTVLLKNGTYAATGSSLTAGLAKFGVALGSGATTAGGAAAAGAAGTGGILGLVTGSISAGVDIFQGVKKSKSGDKKGAKDEYFSAGTKGGMMAAGAGIGAAIGSVVPGAGTAVGALVGGGVGGVVGMFTGDKAGKALSDGSDEGGWLSNAWKATKEFFTEDCKKFFTDTIPEAWGSFWGSVSGFFTETVPTWWEGLTEGVSEFFTETLPEKWNGFWDAVGEFFTEKVPYALGYITGKVYAFFTQTVPAFFGNLWDTVSTFFTETLPEWASGIWNDHIQPFFTEKVPQFFSSLWSSISTFFTETLPEWTSKIWNDHVYPFFTETVPQFFSDLWNSIATFFSETLPEWSESVWNNNIKPFFTETIPGFFVILWNAVSTFFTETLPEWSEGLWSGNILPFFTETIPGFFSSLWDSVTTFFTDTLGDIAEAIWSPISTFFTETIPGWVSSAIGKASDLFGSIKDNFLSGFDAGSGGGDGKGKKARGGIIGGTSSMDAFARGGRTDGGIVGGTTRFIRVNEEAPEMIIPLSSQRRERAMKLWAKTGQMLGIPGFARGGITTGDQDEGLRFHGFGSDSTAGNQSVIVDVGGITIEIKVDGTDKASIVQAIKEQIGDIAESVAEIFTDAFQSQFENTPVRGGVI